MPCVNETMWHDKGTNGKWRKQVGKHVLNQNILRSGPRKSNVRAASLAQRVPDCATERANKLKLYGDLRGNPRAQRICHRASATEELRTSQTLSSPHAATTCADTRASKPVMFMPAGFGKEMSCARGGGLRRNCLETVANTRCRMQDEIRARACAVTMPV